MRVHPGAGREAINGIHDGALKVSITAPPSDGRANEALLRFLAGTLGVPSAQVELVRGAGSRSKVIAIRGLEAAEITTRLKAQG